MGVVGPILSYSQIEGLWDNNGGNPSAAPLAAAVAEAESSGGENSFNNNSDGSQDRGVWQINSVHGALSTFDPNGNAKAAIQISNNGTNWSPWTTFTSGAYRQFLQSGTGPSTTGLPTGSSPGTTPAGATGTPASFNPFNPSDYINAFFNAIFGNDIKDAIERIGLIVIGMILLAIAFFRFTDTGEKTGRQIKVAVKDATTVATTKGVGAAKGATSVGSVSKEAGGVVKEKEKTVKALTPDRTTNEFVDENAGESGRLDEVFGLGS